MVRKMILSIFILFLLISCGSHRWSNRTFNCIQPVEILNSLDYIELPSDLKKSTINYIQTNYHSYSIHKLAQNNDSKNIYCEIWSDHKQIWLVLDQNLNLLSKNVQLWDFVPK